MLCAVGAESQSGKGVEMSQHKELTPPVGPWKGEESRILERGGLFHHSKEMILKAKKVHENGGAKGSGI